MTIHFGQAFNESVLRDEHQTTGGNLYVGANGLLVLLEQLLGLGASLPDVQHLRVAAYRRVLTAYLAKHEQVFFARSMEADALAVATQMLQLRDDLVLSGWDFEAKNAPERLCVFGDLERLWRDDDHLMGLAERVQKVLSVLRIRGIELDEVLVYEPIELLPTYLSRLFAALQSVGIGVYEKIIDTDIGDTDLGRWRTVLAKPDVAKVALKADGSLLILRADRESHAAEVMATLLRVNPTWLPTFLMTQKNRSLEDALQQEGLPSFGMLSSSPSRPTLQMLRLVTAFLWEPLDMSKVLEFVTLPNCPIDYELAREIAQLIAGKPGIGGEYWYQRVGAFFDGIEAKALAGESEFDVAQCRASYQFWFEQPRYTDQVPREHVGRLLEHLLVWATEMHETYRLVRERSATMLLLREQIRRAIELLDAIPVAETTFSPLELDRLIRTVYESAPIQYRDREVGAYPFLYHPAAFAAPVSELIYWNCVDNEPALPLAWWRKDELEYLDTLGVGIDTPVRANHRMIRDRLQPLQVTANRLWLVVPNTIDGVENNEHPLLSYLEATFTDLSVITVSLDEMGAASQLQRWLTLPDWQPLAHEPLAITQPFIQLGTDYPLQHREHESFSSLENIFYYPHKWAMMSKAQLHASEILSVSDGNALLGNLAHRFLELILNENFRDWQQSDVQNWIDTHAQSILMSEGAPLLMYGKEPEKISFLRKVSWAAWRLIGYIRQNGWQVHATEMKLEGFFEGVSLRGYADLVLRRGVEFCIVDIKWRGENYYRNRLKNCEDMQLVLYASLLGTTPLPHTAYFIIEQASIVARNTAAFADISPVAADADAAEIHESIYQKMVETYRWRMSYLNEGDIEIRNQHTISDLEEFYGDVLLDVLEMKQEEARYDDYRTLIGTLE